MVVRGQRVRIRMRKQDVGKKTDSDHEGAESGGEGTESENKEAENKDEVN